MFMNRELYQVIRAAGDYRAIVVITPPGVLPEQTPEAECYAWAEWPLGKDREPRRWYPISALEALLIYNGSSGGDWGYAPLPEQTFDSLDQVTAWIETHKRQKVAA